MFYIFIVYLFVLLFFSVAYKGPLMALAISWLVSCVPIFLKFVEYRYFDFNSFEYAFILIVYLSLFAFGVVLRGGYIRPYNPGNNLSVALRNKYIKEMARWAWYISIVAMVAQGIDFVMLGSASTDDLAQLRDVFQNKVSTPFTLLANVTSWACLYCFSYAIIKKSEFSRGEYLKYNLPAVGYFMVSLLSAGRQAAFQLMLFAIAITLMPKNKSQSEAGKGNYLFVISVSLLMIFYMGFVAVTRNDGAVSDDKTTLLSQIFDFEVSPWFYAATENFPNFRSAIVEAMVYFSSCITLFSEFILLEKTADFHSFGAMTFPFLMRQLEPITGISVLGSLQNKIDLMYSLGAMGNGWTTGLSSYILDFGYWGAGVVLVIIGYYSQHTWVVAKNTKDFNDLVIAVLLVVSAIYTPFLLASAETNLFLLWLVCIFQKKYIALKVSRISHLTNIR